MLCELDALNKINDLGGHVSAARAFPVFHHLTR